ncbi:fibronectin type III domain-containing protein [Kiritimatiellota bacterium B12222]|nr:fibronectin type III domain-containing protein [Kiritimatiellota bacterium B12222]
MNVIVRNFRSKSILISMTCTCLCWFSFSVFGAWSPDLVPETIVFDFRQEDLSQGVVTSWTSGGVKPKTATGTATKLANDGGVLFAGGTSENLSWATDRDAVWLHRWWVVISRADMAGVSANVPVLTVNGAASGNWHNQPSVKFNGSGEHYRSLLNNQSGSVIQEEEIQSSFADWNIMVGYRRGGKFHAWINGVEQAPVDFTGMDVCLDSSPSYLGANNISGESTLAADMAIDCAIVGQSELNDAQVDKLVGWAHWRVGQEALLPANHPYKNAAPNALDANDDPARFEFDESVWNTWAAISTATKTVNIGNPPPSLDDGNGNDYTVVFFDDFTYDTVVDDRSGSPSDVWFAPTHIGSVVGASAQAQKKSATPSTYIHDGSDIGTLTLRLLDVNGNWKTGAFSSVNREGQGRSWGKGRFRIRCKFPAMASPRPGFFPAFWSYGTEHLFWRTRNRIELDFMEYDGLNGQWINTSQHIHTGSLGYNIPEIRQSTDLSDKIIGTTLNSSHNFVPTVDIYDGQYHIWEYRIEDDYSYIIVDDKEVARVPTEAWMLVRRYIMVDWALREWENEAVDGQIYDMTIDWIEVQQRERDLEVVPVAFNALPILSGTRGAGNVITCTPNVTASQIEYRWYENGEPIVGVTESTFVEDAESETKVLRCQVRAVSLLDQPEAWTAELGLPDTEAPSVPQNVSATAVSSSQINLTWDASSDNVAVQGYDIHRDLQWIDVSLTPSYSDFGLSPDTTYTYTVSAFDAVDNSSANSSSASARTQVLNSVLNVTVAGVSTSVGEPGSYGSQDIQGTCVMDVSGDSATLSGNIWKRFGLSYTVSANTMLEFTVNASDTGEITGIALDTDINPTSGRRAFRFGGSDVNSNYDSWSWKVSPVYTSGSGDVTYQIEVGTYFTGAVSYLGLIGDDDSNSSTNITFSNIKLYEQSPTLHVAVNGVATSVGDPISYGTQDIQGSCAIGPSGDSATLTGNIWKCFGLNYTVSTDTVLEVTVNASDVGEIMCIALDNDANPLVGRRVFRLGGSDVNDDYDSWSWQVSPTYISGSGDQTYLIPVGSYFTGSVTYLGLIGDDDANASANVTFSNLKLHESAPAIDFSAVTVSSYDGSQDNGAVVVEDAGATLHLSGNSWKKIDFAHTITSDAVLEFDYKSTSQGDIHGIGFDTNNIIGAEKTFELHGTQTWAIQAFATHTGSDWVHYTIPVGQYFTGAMLYMVFVNDHDVTTPTANGYFKNVKVY